MPVLICPPVLGWLASQFLDFREPQMDAVKNQPQAHAQAAENDEGGRQDGADQSVPRPVKIPEGIFRVLP
jgi:hypothetical protein